MITEGGVRMDFYDILAEIAYRTLMDEKREAEQQQPDEPKPAA